MSEESGSGGADANQEVNKEHSKNIQKFPKVSSYDWFLSFMYPNEIINKGIRPLSYRPVSKKLVRDLFHDRAQILRDRVSKIKFQAVWNTDNYGDLANKRTDGPEIPRTH